MLAVPASWLVNIAALLLIGPAARGLVGRLMLLPYKLGIHGNDV
jgi:hypothetical protein